MKLTRFCSLNRVSGSPLNMSPQLHPPLLSSILFGVYLVQCWRVLIESLLPSKCTFRKGGYVTVLGVLQMQLYKCVEAHGVPRWQRECKDEYDDFMECISFRKQVKDVSAIAFCRKIGRRAAIQKVRFHPIVEWIYLVQGFPFPLSRIKANVCVFSVVVLYIGQFLLRSRES